MFAGERVIVHHGILDPGIEYLPKPFEADTLAAKIRTLIGPLGKPIRVLVIDDEECIREFFREVLVSEGYDVKLAGNGREALQLMKKEKYKFQATIEFEYPVPEGSDVLKEIAKSVDYCRSCLV